MLDKDFITAVAKGWSCKTSIDWKSVSTAELSKYCKQVEDAISQTMKDILKILILNVKSSLNESFCLKRRHSDNLVYLYGIKISVM